MSYTASDRDLRGHLPLSHLDFEVLVSLAQRDLHGYAMAVEIKKRSRGLMIPGMSSLYLSIRRLAKGGFVEDAGSREELPGRPQRRYYRITARGRRLAHLEAVRLQDQARSAADVFLNP